MEETVEATRARVGSTPPLDPGRLTIVLTTSPIKTHPSTRLIEEVFESAAVLAGLGGCRKIIVADGVKVREHDKFRSGICTPDAMANYGHYLSRLDALTKTEGSPLCGAELLALDERHGFAHALRRGLMRVATPFVLVAQHDRSFVRPVEVSHVLDVMETGQHKHAVHLERTGELRGVPDDDDAVARNVRREQVRARGGAGDLPRPRCQGHRFEPCR